MRIAGSILELVLYVFLILLLVRLVVDWIQMFARRWEPHGVLLVSLEVVYTTTDPPVKLLRRLIPPVRLGQIMLDLSFLVLLLLVYIALSVVSAWNR